DEAAHANHPAERRRGIPGLLRGDQGAGPEGRAEEQDQGDLQGAAEGYRRAVPRWRGRGQGRVLPGNPGQDAQPQQRGQGQGHRRAVQGTEGEVTGADRRAVRGEVGVPPAEEGRLKLPTRGRARAAGGPAPASFLLAPVALHLTLEPTPCLS